jgi:nucleotide sugar dehydrogenase
MYLKPEDIDTEEKRSKLSVAIIGCGSTGILHAFLFAEAGFKVTCADADQTIVNLLAKGRAPFERRELEARLKVHAKTGRMTATSDMKAAASQSDIIALTAPVKIDAKKKPDYSETERICKQVGLSLRHNTLVIVMSVVGSGIVDRIYREKLEDASGLKAGADFGLAYSPLRSSQEQTPETLTNQQRIVAAFDNKSLEAASLVLGTISKGGTKNTTNVKAAEMLFLFESSRTNANAAVANELALLCEKLKIDYLQVQELSRTQAPSMLPSPASEDESDREKSSLLLEDAEDVNTKLRIVPLSQEVNKETVKRAVNLASDALRNCGRTVRRARVALLGISQAPNARTPPKRMVLRLAEALKAKGARVSFYDPYYSDLQTADFQPQSSRTLAEAVEGTECVIIATGHDEFRNLNLKRLKLMMRKQAAVVDLEGILEPCEVEKEGLIYRGLGRGVWTK